MNDNETNTPETTADASNWYDTASDAVRSGFSDAKQSAERALPAAVNAISKGVFGLGYGIGYAATFPAVLVARVTPQENCVVWGLIDGAHVARDMAYRDRGEQ